MEVKVRRVLDYTQPINLKRLKPLDKIKASLMVYWLGSNFAKNKERQRLEKEHKERSERDEKFKKDLLVLLNNELRLNTTLGVRKEIASTIIVDINYDQADCIHRVLGIDEDGNKDPSMSRHKVFMPYIIERVEEDKDFRMAMPELPILLRCTLRMIGGKT